MTEAVGSLVEAAEESSIHLQGAGEVLLRKCIISARIVGMSGSDKDVKMVSWVAINIYDALY